MTFSLLSCYALFKLMQFHSSRVIQFMYNFTSGSLVTRYFNDGGHCRRGIIRVMMLCLLNNKVIELSGDN